MSVVVRRPKISPCLRDLKALDGVTGDSARAAKMIELLTGLTEREAELVQLEDVAGLGALVARFSTPCSAARRRSRAGAALPLAAIGAGAPDAR